MLINDDNRLFSDVNFSLVMSDDITMFRDDNTMFRDDNKLFRDDNMLFSDYSTLFSNNNSGTLLSDGH